MSVFGRCIICLGVGHFCDLCIATDCVKRIPIQLEVKKKGIGGRKPLGNPRAATLKKRMERAGIRKGTGCDGNRFKCRRCNGSGVMRYADFELKMYGQNPLAKLEEK